MHALSLNHISFSWPDGTPVFVDLSFAVPLGVSALVGRNGIGKSTLMRLLAGDLRPTLGQLDRPSRLAYVPQSVTLATGATVAEVLGVAPKLRALREIEAGRGEADDFDALGDDWLVEERLLATLGSLGLSEVTIQQEEVRQAYQGYPGCPPPPGVQVVSASVPAQSAGQSVALGTLVNGAPWPWAGETSVAPAANWISAIARNARRTPSHTSGVSG